MATNGVGAEIKSQLTTIFRGATIVGLLGVGLGGACYLDHVKNNVPAHLRQYDFNSDGLADLVLQNKNGKTLEVFYATKDRGYLTLDEIKLDRAQQ